MERMGLILIVVLSMPDLPQSSNYAVLAKYVRCMPRMAPLRLRGGAGDERMQRLMKALEKSLSDAQPDDESEEDIEVQCEP